MNHITRNSLLTDAVVVTPMPQLAKDGLQLRDAVGIIPLFVTDPDKPLIESLSEGYGFGWRHMDGFVLDKENMSITYQPGTENEDPAILPWAVLRPISDTNKDVAYIYRYGWVLVLRGDGTFEISRMD